jgi:hypothetical protein
MTYTTRLARTAAVALLAGTALAHAQSVPSLVNHGGFSPPVKGTNEGTPAPAAPAPPALPGAASNEPAAPAEKLPTDLPPTEALFDAINRGDMASARDALARGADLSGTNVLGMTPLELSVDLDRNDITFLLLSERAADSSRSAGPAAAAMTKTANAKGGKAGASALRPVAQASAATALGASVRAVRLPTAPTPMQPASVRYAGSDPGTAVPQAGFLGFGGGAIGQP